MQAFHYIIEWEVILCKRNPLKTSTGWLWNIATSELTDYQWCIEHDIKPGTFYNWLKRLRQKGTGLPANGVDGKPTRQEVVKLDIPKPPLSASVFQPAVLLSSENCPNKTLTGFPAVDLSLAGAILQIPQQTDTIFPVQPLRILRNELCQGTSPPLTGFTLSAAYSHDIFILIFSDNSH